MTDEQEFIKWFRDAEHKGPRSAFLAALAIGRKSGMEEAAEIAREHQGTMSQFKSEISLCSYNDACRDIAKGIRQRIEATND